MAFTKELSRTNWKWISTLLFALGINLASNEITLRLHDTGSGMSHSAALVFGWMAMRQFALTGWILFVGLAVFVIRAYRFETKRVPARVLEHHLTHAMVQKLVALNPDATEGELKERLLWLDGNRESLFNQKVLLPAFYEKLRNTSIDTAEAKRIIEGMTNSELRSTLIARVDDYVKALCEIWQRSGQGGWPTL